MQIVSNNPSTEHVNKTYSAHSKAEALQIAAKAHKAFEHWKDAALDKRTAHMLELADALRSNKEHYAKLITMEMGKPISQSLDEIEKCAWTAELYAAKAKHWLKEHNVRTGAKKSYVSFEPLGTVLCVMPWNFPFWQALRCAIPTMTAGNTVVLRHSNAVPMCALAIQQAFYKAGFPDNSFSTVLCDHQTVNALIASDNINGVSVTGSVDAGISIATQASKSLKKYVLELGGSDPFIVLEDADLELAAKQAAGARLLNTGQSCIAAKRFIVELGVYDQFAELLVKHFNEQTLGDPMLKSTTVGPLSSKEQLKAVEAQVEDAVRKGAKIKTGGNRVERKGYFYEPTVLTHVNSRMRVLKEEVFGPVAPLIAAKDVEDAIKIANQTEFGLGASIWSRHIKRAERLAHMIDAGTVTVNKIVRSDPRLPFGGIKKSGIGRELSHYGMHEFTNIKAISINS